MKPEKGPRRGKREDLRKRGGKNDHGGMHWSYPCEGMMGGKSVEEEGQPKQCLKARTKSHFMLNIFKWGSVGKRACCQG